MGGTPKSWLMEEKYFLPILIGSGMWKELGWSTILYLAALTSIDPELYEVARIDGAGALLVKANSCLVSVERPMSSGRQLVVIAMQ